MGEGCSNCTCKTSSTTPVKSNDSWKGFLAFIAIFIGSGLLGAGLRQYRLSHSSVLPAKVDAAPLPEAVAESAVQSDELSRKAMAPDPVPEREQLSLLGRGFVVEVLSAAAELRAGPGAQFGLVSTIHQGKSLPVVDSSERWFRVINGAHPDGAPKSFAWIRNDAVKLVKKSQ